MMKKILLCCLSILLVSSVSFALPQPQARVKQMVDSILAVLQQPDLNTEQKKVQVSGKVQEYLNIQSMSRRTLGSYWDGATEDQRQHFSKLFVKILEGTYLSRIDDYSAGIVQYQKQRVKDDKAIVDTVIVSKDLEIPVQYKMIYEGDAWQIFDLVIEGVSLIKNYRSSYGEIIRQSGYDGLLTLMSKKVQAMESAK